MRVLVGERPFRAAFRAQKDMGFSPGGRFVAQPDNHRLRAVSTSETPWQITGFKRPSGTLHPITLPQLRFFSESSSSLTADSFGGYSIVPLNDDICSS